MDTSQSDSSALHLSNSTPSINQDSSLQTSTTLSTDTSNVNPQMMFDIDFSTISLHTETSDGITSNTSNTSKLETSVTNTTNSNHTSELKTSSINISKPTNTSSSEEPSTQEIPLATPNLLSTSPLITQPTLASINSINNTLPLPLIPPVYPFPLNNTSSPLHTDILKNMQKYPNFKAAIPRNQLFKGRPPKPISPISSSPRPPLITNPLAASASVTALKGQPILQSRLPTQPITPTLPLKSKATNPVVPNLASTLATNLTNPINPLATINYYDTLLPFYNTTMEQLKPEFKNKLKEDFNKLKMNQLSLDQFISKTKEYLNAKQIQTLQNLKLQFFSKTTTPEDILNSTKKRKMEENNSSTVKKTKSESNNNTNYMGPPPPRINQLFPIDTPGIGGNKVNNNTSKTHEIDVTKLDSESLGDVMKYVGVDLKEETDNILRDNEILNMQQQQINQTDDRSKAQSFLSVPFLSKMVEEITSKNDITKVEPDYYNCLALAAQERIRNLVEQMILASKHRVGLLHDFFMEESKAKKAKVGEDTYEFSVVVKDDVRKALQLIERHERDKERRERQRRGEEEEGRGDGKDGDGKGTSKRKKNKTVKNKDVPDAVKQRITNETALRAAGGSGKKYSWMTQSSNDEWRASSLHFHKSSSSQSKGGDSGNGKGDKKLGDEGGKGFDSKRSFGASKSGKSGSSLLKRKDDNSQGRTGSSKSRNALRRTISQKDMYRVILKDAIFTLENDKYYKRSNLLYKWYTM
ncbi:transcription initiation factor TFIID component TAF4 family-domain-containing protein [Neocallimastix sp. 'constans']|jgi:hypothetical protein